MSEKIFLEILNGAKPSQVFRSYIESGAGLTKYDVAQKFSEAFPEADTVFHQIIWNWQSPDSPQRSIQDAALDELLLDILSKSGYVIN